METYRQSLFNETTNNSTTGEFLDLLINGNLEVIGNTTLAGHTLAVSNAQWGYLEGLDQALATTNNVNFLTVNGRDVAIDGAKLDTLDESLQYLTAAEIAQLVNIDAVTISNTQWGYLGSLNQALSTTDAVGFLTVNGRDVAADGIVLDGLSALGSLTAAEIAQLENIDLVTISNAQWGYLGDLDQPLTTTSSPTWAGIKLSNSGYTTTISSATLGASQTFTWPATDGKAGQVLGTDGSGNLAFQDDGLFSNQDTYAFSSDTDSGLKYVAADELALFTGGTNRFTLSSTAATLIEPLSITDTTDSSNTTTGCIIAAGGLGIAKDFNYLGDFGHPNSNQFNIYTGSDSSAKFADASNRRAQAIRSWPFDGSIDLMTSTVGATGAGNAITWESMLKVKYNAITASQPLTITDTPAATTDNSFRIESDASLGGTTGNYQYLTSERFLAGGNQFFHTTAALRDSTGTTWPTAEHVDFLRIDSSYGTPDVDARCAIHRNPYNQTFEFKQTSRVDATIRSGGISLPDGTAALPSLAFAGDTNTGLYWVSADRIGISAGGSVGFTVSNTDVSCQSNVKLTIQETTDATNTSNGSVRLLGGLSSAKAGYFGGSLTTNSVVLAAAGTAAAPSHAFETDSDTGMYSKSGNVLGFATGGSLRAEVSSSGSSFYGTTHNFWNSAATQRFRFYPGTTNYVQVESGSSLRICRALTTASTITSFDVYADAHNLNGVTNITNTTEASSSTVGALTVSGGVAVAKSITAGAMPRIGQYNNVDQSITTSTITKVNFNSNRFSSTNGPSYDSKTSIFTINEVGTYQIQVSLDFDNTGTAYSYYGTIVDGATIIRKVSRYNEGSLSSGVTTLTMTATEFFNDGATFYINVWHNTGSTDKLKANVPYGISMTCVKLH